MVKLDLGLALLPEDRRFIEKILAGQPPQIIDAALEDYKKVWQSACDAEPHEHKKDNKGRRAANTFLREIVWPSICAHTNRAA